MKQEGREIKPYQEIIEILNLGDEDGRKEVKIGNNKSKEVRGNLCDLLKEFRDVFAWSYQDMLGLDTDIVQHKLPFKEECPPVKQKLR